MTILFALLFGLAGGVAGFLAGALVSGVIAGAMHMSNMEGARGYFAVAVGLLTGVIGMVLSIILTLRWRGVTNLAGVLGGSLATIGGLIALAAAGVGLYYISIPHPIHRGGPPVYLKFEIVPPAGGQAPDLATWETELNTDKNSMPAYWDRDAHDQLNGRPVAAGRVELYYRTTQRLLVMKMPNREARIFRLRLPADPTGSKFRQWSDWRKADFADAPGQDHPAPKDSDYSIRYLIETNVAP
jgi:hypothetical protein